MTPFTVTYHPDAEAGLATAWADAVDRSAAAAAVDRVDRLLRERPESAGRDLHEGLRSVEDGPLKFLFEVHPDDRRVLVTSVRLLPGAARGGQYGSNGRSAE